MDLIVPGPAFQRKDVPSATGPSTETDLTSGFHVGQLSTAVTTSQTVSGAAAISNSQVPTTGADALISVRVIFPLPSSG